MTGAGDHLDGAVTSTCGQPISRCSWEAVGAGTLKDAVGDRRFRGGRDSLGAQIIAAGGRGNIRRELRMAIGGVTLVGRTNQARVFMAGTRTGLVATAGEAPWTHRVLDCQSGRTLNSAARPGDSIRASRRQIWRLSW